jgi:hypothetical protein
METETTPPAKKKKRISDNQVIQNMNNGAKVCTGVLRVQGPPLIHITRGWLSPLCQVGCEARVSKVTLSSQSPRRII